MQNVTPKENQEMIDFYSKATNDDAGSKSLQQVRNSRLWKGYVGTVFGKPVSTEKGSLFDIRKEARQNALFFIQEVKKVANA